MFLFQSRISYARQNVREDSEPNHLEDSEMTPRSCVDEDSELKLLTSRCETTSVQSLPQSVRLLQSQLKAERLASAQLRLEVKDAMKMSEDCRAPSCLKSSVDASIVDTTEVYSASSAVWGCLT